MDRSSARVGMMPLGPVQSFITECDIAVFLGPIVTSCQVRQYSQSELVVYVVVVVVTLIKVSFTAFIMATHSEYCNGRLGQHGQRVVSWMDGGMAGLSRVMVGHL